MNDIFTANLISAFILILLYVSFLFTPNLSRKDLIFGVLIPLDRTKDSAIKKIIKDYYTQITASTVILSAIYFYVLNTAFKASSAFLLAIYLLLIIYFFIFLKANHKVKAYKLTNNLLENKKQLLYVNTELSKKLKNNAVLPLYWFILPFAIALLNLILPLINYENLPSKLAIHFNLSGRANGFISKSLPSVWYSGLGPLILVFILAFANWSIAISKNRIDASKPVSSSQKLYKFKRFNSIMLYALSVLLSTIITLFNLNYLKIIAIDLDNTIFLQVLLFAVVMTAPIILSLKLGQGGSNLKDVVDENIDNSVTNIDDDTFWKLGLIYYNPNDPSIIVEKRFGIGWTLNFGNKIAMFISIIFLLVVAAIISMPIIFS